MKINKFLILSILLSSSTLCFGLQWHPLWWHSEVSTPGATAPVNNQNNNDNNQNTEL